MKKYCFIIDVAKCENCNNCFLSCKDEHCDNDWLPYTLAQPLHGQRWMNIFRNERGRFPLIDVAYLPKPCMHCEDAPCIAQSKDGGVYRRDDGIVVIDPIKARGQKQIVAACPFGVVWWNEEEQIPQKCTFCVHLLERGWKKTRCQQACPTGALSVLYVEDDKLAEIIAEEKLETLDNGGTTARPRCYYKNLYRFVKCMIMGSVAVGKNDISECVVGAGIRLYKNGDMLAEQLSDDFGDFKFDGLDKAGNYEIEVLIDGKMVHKLEVVLDKSMSLGTIWITPEKG